MVVVVVGVCADEEGGMLRVEEAWDIWGGRVGAGGGRGKCGCDGVRHGWVSS